MKKITTALLACVMTVIIAGLDARADVIAPDLKVVLQSPGPDKDVAVIVTLADTVDLEKFKDKDRALRRNKIIKALKNKSTKTQKNIKKYLKLKKVRKIKSFWIFNGLALTANAEVIEKLALMEGIKSISLDVTLSMSEPPVSGSTSTPEWNMNAINAPELWSRGHTGTGIVLASMDTGVDVNHQDLVSRWRGGSNSWYDPHSGSTIPYDSETFRHGTGVMGVMVGGNAGGSAIGVAPAAQWIAVKIFDDAGDTTYEKIHEGFEWLLDPDGDPYTDDAPDVVNNSWGYYQPGGTCLEEFIPDIQALKASEIGVVFSAGNRGPNISTSESPANNPGSFAVGAVDESLDIHFKSSRGPSTCDDSFYPEAVAPGINILTAYLTFGGRHPDSYATVSGTSIAAPHVAGAMGLLLSAYPSLTINEIETALKTSALDLGDSGPDNIYGHGLLDVIAAYNLLSQNKPQAPVARNDRFTMPRNTNATIYILANDTDPDGTIDETTVTFRSANTLKGGTVTADENGIVTYIPEGGGGPDYFWYTVQNTDGVASNEVRVRVNRVRAE